MNEDICALSW